MKEILYTQNSVAIFCHVYPASLLDVYTDNCLAALVDESGIIAYQVETHSRP
jgi:hypothetical protein